MFCELGEEMFGTGCLHQSTKVFVAYHQYPLTTVSSAENAVVFEMKFYFLAFTYPKLGAPACHIFMMHMCV